MLNLPLPLFAVVQEYVVQELVSPVITPFLLCFNLRYKALDIVDFFRNFTVDVVGVGDVCSFAQMDVKRHGNPEVCLQQLLLLRLFLCHVKQKNETPNAARVCAKRRRG